MVRVRGVDLIGPASLKFLRARCFAAIENAGPRPDPAAVLLDRASCFQATQVTDPFLSEPGAIARLRALVGRTSLPAEISDENRSEARRRAGSGTVFAAWALRIKAWQAAERLFLSRGIESLNLGLGPDLVEAGLAGSVLAFLDGHAEHAAALLSSRNQRFVAAIPVRVRPALLRLQGAPLLRGASLRTLEDVEAAEEEAHATAIGIDHVFQHVSSFSQE